MAKRKKTGTREWAETTENIQIGCEHGCRYCYARFGAVVFHKYCTAEQWEVPVISAMKVNRSFLKRAGVIMFPSAHDITELNITECVTVLRSMLEAGNQVLVVSKPNLDCIKILCEKFYEYRKSLRFRFSIGSSFDAVLNFWEPNAPCFQERFECLVHVNSQGFVASVSGEPFLDVRVDQVVALFEMCQPLISEFWIGKLRNFDSRVNLDGVGVEDMDRFVVPLKAAQDDAMMTALYRILCNEEKIRWKDSIQDVLEKRHILRPGACPIDLATAWGL